MEIYRTREQGDRDRDEALEAIERDILGASGERHDIGLAKLIKDETE